MKPRHQTLAHDATTNTRRQLQLIRARSPRRRAQRQKVACFRQRPVAHSPQGGYRRINGQGCNDRPVTVHKGQGVQFGAAVEVADGHLNIRRHLVVAVIPLLPREAVGLVRGTVSQNPCSSNIALVLFPLVPAIELYRRVTPAHEDGPNCLPGRAMTARDRLVPEGVQIGSTPLQLQDSCEAVTYFLVCQPRPGTTHLLLGTGGGLAPPSVSAFAFSAAFLSRSRLRRALFSLRSLTASRSTRPPAPFALQSPSRAPCSLSVSSCSAVMASSRSSSWPGPKMRPSPATSKSTPERITRLSLSLLAITAPSVRCRLPACRQAARDEVSPACLQAGGTRHR